MIAARASTSWAVRVSPLVSDTLLAGLVASLSLVSLLGLVAQARLTEEGSVDFRAADAAGVTLLLIGTLSLAWRRRAPVLVLAVSCLAFIPYQALGYATPPLPFAALVALATVATGSALVVSTSATALIVVGLVVQAGAFTTPLNEDQFLAYLTSVVAAWTLGGGVRLNRARTTLLEEQAVQLAREQAVKTELAVEQERARISREMHDIVAHSVSVMVAQAAAAQRVFAAEPAQAQQALGSIAATGRGALTEMRRLLGVLSTDQAAIWQPPQPGLEQLPSLVTQVRRAGLPVQLTVHGMPRPLSAGVELSAYRIVQEALTNSLKHADATQAKVGLEYLPGSLKLQIHDDGHGGPPNLVAGHGLVGMTQRAELLGGDIAVGASPDGGFRVTANLPVGEPP